MKNHINDRDMKDYTPIQYAAAKGNSEVVLALAKLGSSWTEKCASAGKSVVDWMPHLKPKLESLQIHELIPGVVPEYIHSVRNSEDGLWSCLENKDLTGLKTLLSSDPSIDVNIVRGGESSLTFVTRHYTTDEANITYKTLEILLENRANVNFKNSNCWTAAHNSAHHGDISSLRLLAHNGADLKAKNNSQETPLHLLLSHAPKETLESKEFCNWFKDLKDEIDTNAQDDNGNTCLHYAAYRSLDSLVMQLLHHDADISIKNFLGEAALSFVSPQILKSYLDSFVTSSPSASKKSFKMTFDYNCLVKGSQSDRLSESEAVRLFCNDKIHHKLLTHPLVKSFIYLKWERCRFYYYINTVFYLFYIIFLTTYLHNLFPLQEEQDKLVSVVEQNQMEKIDNVPMIDETFCPLCVIVMVLNTLLLIRELFQLSINPLYYIKKFENILEWVMVIFVYIVLFNSGFSEEQRRALAAVALFLGWIELVLLLGRHRIFSISVEIFSLVSRNFCYVLFWYSNVLLAFIFTFHLLFEHQNDFQDFVSSSMKVVSMMVGELNYDTLLFKDQPFMGRVLFVLFLFFVTIILMNLFTGLAVDDTRSIRKQAEMISQKSQIELIYYIENLFFFKKTDNISPSERVCCSMFHWCELMIKKLHILLKPICHLLELSGKYTLLFQSTLPKRKASIHMHIGGKCFPKWDFYVDTDDKSSLKLSHNIVKDAKMLLDNLEAQTEKKQGTNEDTISLKSLNDRLKALEIKLEENFEKLFKQMSNLAEKD